MGGALEAYGSRFVCVCVYLFVTHVSWRPLQTRHWSRQCRHNVTVSQNQVSDFSFSALFSGYSVICSPRRLLHEIQSQAMTKLFTAGCFLTRQSCLCHRPGSDVSENTKMRPSKASCPLPRCCSVSAIKGVVA